MSEILDLENWHLFESWGVGSSDGGEKYFCDSSSRREGEYNECTFSAFLYLWVEEGNNLYYGYRHGEAISSHIAESRYPTIL